MKKVKLLSVLIIVLILGLSVFAACKKDTPEETPPAEIPVESLTQDELIVLAFSDAVTALGETAELTDVFSTKLDAARFSYSKLSEDEKAASESEVNKFLTLDKAYFSLLVNNIGTVSESSIMKILEAEVYYNLKLMAPKSEVAADNTTLEGKRTAYNNLFGSIYVLFDGYIATLQSVTGNSSLFPNGFSSNAKGSGLDMVNALYIQAKQSYDGLDGEKQSSVSAQMQLITNANATAILAVGNEVALVNTKLGQITVDANLAGSALTTAKNDILFVKSMFYDMSALAQSQRGESGFLNAVTIKETALGAAIDTEYNAINNLYKAIKAAVDAPASANWDTVTANIGTVTAKIDDVSMATGGAGGKYETEITQINNNLFVANGVNPSYKTQVSTLILNKAAAFNTRITTDFDSYISSSAVNTAIRGTAIDNADTALQTLESAYAALETVVKAEFDKAANSFKKPSAYRAELNAVSLTEAGEFDASITTAVNNNAIANDTVENSKTAIEGRYNALTALINTTDGTILGVSDYTKDTTNFTEIYAKITNTGLTGYLDNVLKLPYSYDFKQNAVYNNTNYGSNNSYPDVSGKLYWEGTVSNIKDEPITGLTLKSRVNGSGNAFQSFTYSNGIYKSTGYDFTLDMKKYEGVALPTDANGDFIDDNNNKLFYYCYNGQFTYEEFKNVKIDMSVEVSTFTFTDTADMSAKTPLLILDNSINFNISTGLISTGANGGSGPWNVGSTSRRNEDAASTIMTHENVRFNIYAVTDTNSLAIKTDSAINANAVIDSGKLITSFEKSVKDGNKFKPFSMDISHIKHMIATSEWGTAYLERNLGKDEPAREKFWIQVGIQAVASYEKDGEIMFADSVMVADTCSPALWTTQTIGKIYLDENNLELAPPILFERLFDVKGQSEVEIYRESGDMDGILGAELTFYKANDKTSRFGSLILKKQPDGISVLFVKNMTDTTGINVGDNIPSKNMYMNSAENIAALFDLAVDNDGISNFPWEGTEFYYSYRLLSDPDGGLYSKDSEESGLFRNAYIFKSKVKAVNTAFIHIAGNSDAYLMFNKYANGEVMLKPGNQGVTSVTVYVYEYNATPGFDYKNNAAPRGQFEALYNDAGKLVLRGEGFADLEAAGGANDQSVNGEDWKNMIKGVCGITGEDSGKTFIFCYQVNVNTDYYGAADFTVSASPNAIFDFNINKKTV